MPTPDTRLPGGTTTEKAVARARDDIRLAKDWQTYYMKMFERKRYTLSRPTNTHLLPDADRINGLLDNILSEAITKCKESIDEHLQSCIQAAEEKAENPPESAETQMWQKITKKFESHYEATMQNMMEAMTKTILTLSAGKSEMVKASSTEVEQEQTAQTSTSEK